LIAADQLGPLATTIGDTEFRIGDRVIAHRNRYDLGILNGDIGTITGGGEHSLQIELDSGRRVNLPIEYVTESLRHSYARTVNSAQGLTCEIGLMLGDDGLYAELGYTALTRATRENRVYTVVSRADFESDDYHLQPLINSLDRSHAKTAAIDYLDPLER
jgi:ATP-dependent exoDNAse (exonuclease V) alpha subunit